MKKTDCSKEKNSLKVSLENFQSISKADLEFIQGINLIVGQSNSGKSAILRAIKGAILNPNGSQKYIKNGKNGFKVNVEYEGNSIEWSRGAKSPKYVVNGEEYLKVGNSNLTDILDKSGFVLDENKNLMNIESELELPFPFDKNNSELFKLFEKNIFCISDSTAIVKLIKADEDETNRQKENTEYELDRYKQKLQAVNELEADVDLNKLIEGRNELSSLFEKKDKLLLDINSLSSIIDMGKILSKDIPTVEIDTDIQHAYSTLLTDIHKLEGIRGVGSVLSKDIPTASTPVVDVTAYKEMCSDVVQLIQADKVLSNLSPVATPTISFMSEEYISLREDINELLRLCEQAQNLQKDISIHKSTIERLADEKNKFKVCPLCGGPLKE